MALNGQKDVEKFIILVLSPLGFNEEPMLQCINSFKQGLQMNAAATVLICYLVRNQDFLCHFNYIFNITVLLIELKQILGISMQ